MSIQRAEIKPNWKQLVPIYGIYQSVADRLRGEPSILDKKNPKNLYGGIVYHTVVSIFPFVKGLEKLSQGLEKFLL